MSREEFKKSYYEKLLDPRWQKKRAEIWKRDNHTCQFCGSDRHTLQVHHRYYVSRRAPWDYPDWSLVTSCKNCHKIEHGIAIDEIGYWEYLIGSICETEADLWSLHEAVDAFRCDMHANPNVIRETIIEVLKKKSKRPSEKAARARK
jgi:hypothetical protein